MLEQTKINKLSQAYDLLSDCNEVYLKTELEGIMKARGFKVVVSRNKYKFKWVGKNGTD